MAKPPTETLKQDVLDILPQVEKVLLEAEGMLLRNRIFIDRTQGIGILKKDLAIEMGVSGAMLRSTGVDYDATQGASVLALRAL
ncbi:MAG: hypothetical protein IPK60_25730 [Sandaracinaceae bacterium]|nr:hypothetical protein [Sandaracinaceae bacterium]